MKRTKNFKLLLVIITAIAALFACVFTLVPKAQRAAEAATTPPVLAEVTAEMPETMSNTDTSTFDIVFYIDYAEGAKSKNTSFYFGYDVEKVEYVGYEYNEYSSAVGADPADATERGEGWKSVTIASAKLDEKHNAKMMTFTFRLKSGLQDGDKVVFQLDSFKAPVFLNGKIQYPRVADGTLVLPTLEILVTA